MEINQRDLHRAIEKGLAKRIVQETKGPKTISRAEWLKDFCEFIGREQLSDDELRLLYTAVNNKMRSRTCGVCGHLSNLMFGDYIHVSMDLSKPKVFRCQDCKEKDRT